MIYSRAIATSGLPCLHSQKLSGDAFIQLNGAPYTLPPTHCHCSRQMLGCIGVTAEGHLLNAVRMEGSTHIATVMRWNLHGQQPLYSSSVSV